MNEAAKPPREAVDGVLLLDKPRGLTSQQAVSRAKRLLGALKAGHTGTLDPMASGLLPIGFGEATKFTQFLLDADKGYLATLRLGVTTTTGDAEGQVLATRTVSVSAEQLARVLAKFVGAQQQVPPMHSALKVDGRPLYAYARAGESVERKPRTIIIDAIQLIEYKEEFIQIRVLCSKGTYIRVLAEDIGAALGCGAHLTALVREHAGGFSLAEARSLEALEALDLAMRRQELLPPDAFASALPVLDLGQVDARRLCQGLEVVLAGTADGSYRLYGPTDRFLGVGVVASGILRAQRLVSQSGTQKPENGLSNPAVTG